MCGIAGKVSLNSKAITSSEITRMTDAIAYRGPDDQGQFLSSDKKVGLGHRRLAIIDLSPLGHQPMSYLGRYQIVFNGEIYNYLEERERLLADGYVFRSQSDTEVIMALYDKYQEKCLDHLRGMFSFVIYDQKEHRIFGARDRVGKKPLKYYLDDKVFIFASELKAILTQPECPKEPDYVAIHHYLTLQYCPSPSTGFKGIKKLLPAHYFYLDLQTGKMTVKSYWHLDYSHKLQLSENAWKEKILDKLEESVRLRMISDVPLGAFLSGGIDSSAVVGMMSRHSTQPVKTFSIGFEEEAFNELPYARRIAEKFGTDHTEFIVQPNAMEVLPMLVRHYEEPYADSSALPTYYVSKLTRDHVTVALNGDGGDENFAGYSRYSVMKFGAKYEKMRFLHNSLVAPAVGVMSATIPHTFFERLNRFSKTLKEDYRRRYLSYTSFFTEEQKVNLYTEEFKQKVAHYDTYGFIAQQFVDAKTPDPLDQTVYADIVTYLPDDLLAKVDIASMAVSLEGRSPFLDHELLEMTAQIPSNLKIKGLDNKKYILKKALEDLLPHDVMHRPKRGFSMPIDAWFRTSLKDYSRDILLSPEVRQRGIFREKELTHLLDEHCATKINQGNKIWALLTLELWFREFID